LFSFLDGQQRDYEFLETFDYLKHNLGEVGQIAFYDTQDFENEFVWPFDTMKHRFIEFNKVVF
jgi:hypothetical protein